MSKMPALKPKQVLKALLRAGFFVERQAGSHAQLRHAKNPSLRVTIPCHARFDLPAEVVASIIKQAGLSREEFLAML